MDDYILTETIAEQNRRSKIRTFTGRYIDPMQVRWSDVCIEDVAHHLACINRYTGAAPQPYNVADHSLLVAALAKAAGEPWPVVFACQMHDSGEYLFNDLASPVKRHGSLQFYKRREHETTRMIMAGFGIDPDLLAVVKKYDEAAFHMEVRSWWGGTREVVPLPWDESERRFLNLFNTLRRLQ